MPRSMLDALMLKGHGHAGELSEGPKAEKVPSRMGQAKPPETGGGGIDTKPACGQGDEASRDRFDAAKFLYVGPRSAFRA
ncbi:hypothetical protein CIW54_17385 [Paraburkholderia sp. T12-10]|nr:hypothetical protein CIW54_17385 [Paraburkholderia sp. T12-10]